MKVLIIDDEEKASDVLLLQLQFHIPEITTIWLSDGAEEATQLLKAHQPGDVFLDIKMPKMDGFSWLKSLEQYNFHVVFPLHMH